MSDDPARPRLLPVEEAARLLGIAPGSVMRAARRNGWKRVKSNAGHWLVEVSADMLEKPAVAATDTVRGLSADLSALTKTIADLSRQLDRETGDRRVLQSQADELRERLAAAQVAAAEAAGVAMAEKARREAAEARGTDLARQVEELRQRANKRRWWPF